MSKLASVVLVACFATLSLCGCNTPVPDDDILDEPAPAELGKEEPKSCDDLDTYCGPSRPCDAGYICAYAPNQCGQNVSGTYPNCVTTATCYPVCIPGNKS